MKEDEKRFLIDLYNANKHVTGGNITEVTPRDIINSLDFYIHYKRAWYILGKWSGNGWYDYGCTLDLGWLTEEGKSIAKGLSEAF